MVEEVNDDGLTFREWMRKVNGILAARCGLTANDLADGPSWDTWNDGGSPEDYASDLLYDNGFPSDLL